MNKNCITCAHLNWQVPNDYASYGFNEKEACCGFDGLKTDVNHVCDIHELKHRLKNNYRKTEVEEE